MCVCVRERERERESLFIVSNVCGYERETERERGRECVIESVCGSNQKIPATTWIRKNSGEMKIKLQGENWLNLFGFLGESERNREREKEKNRQMTDG